jgi:O-acetylserine/cysteine efflux transporter
VSALVPVGLTLFAGQFLFQFFGIAQGMPPGLAAIVVHTQALFTIAFAALLLAGRPTARQWLGAVVALSGLALIALTVGGDVPLAAFVLTLGSPVSFGLGNVLLKRLGPVDMPALIAWLSLVPPLPALALSINAGWARGAAAGIGQASGAGIAAVLFLGVVATTIAYAIWGALLRRYPAAVVGPFTLLVPFVGAAASAAVFGERFGVTRLVGMLVVLVGLAVIVLPRAAAASMARAAGVETGQ